MLPAHITANRARSIVIETLLHEDSGLDASKIALIDRMELKGRMLTIYATDGSSHTVTLPKGVSPEALQEELDTLVKASDFERFKNSVATTMALKVDAATLNAALDSIAARLKGEPGEPGASVANVELQGDELVFTLTNGETFTTEAPRGAPGEKGEEGDHIVDAGLRPEPEGDKIVFTTAQGAEISMLAPKGPEGPAGPEGPRGPKGEQGLQGPGYSPNVSRNGNRLTFQWANPATGEQRHSSVTLPDSIPGPTGPQGPAGDPGKDGVSPPPPTLRVDQVQTLPPGSSATAHIGGEAPDYTLTLGVPQGPQGDAGKDAVIQDTGWYDITEYTNPPAGATVQGRLYLRRVGPQVFLYAHGYTFGGNFTARSFFAPGLCDYTRPPGTRFGAQMRAAGTIPIGDIPGVAFIYDWLSPNDLRMSCTTWRPSWGITSWLTDTPFPVNVLGTPGGGRDF